jgi:hypothetical protein
MAPLAGKFENILAAAQRLSRRERFMLGGVVIAFVFFVGFLVWLWVSSSLSSLERRIADKSKDLQKIIELRAEYDKAKQTQKSIESTIAKARSIQLMGTLEQLARQIGINTADLEMNPRATASNPDSKVDEEKVEVNLKRITIDRLIEFLEKVEEKSKTIAVRTLHVRKNFQDPSQLDVGFTVSKFQLREEKKPDTGASPKKKP